MQAWESLEEAEYRRELALRNELIRQEKLEQLARRFDRKAAMRETWLNENQRLVAQVTDRTGVAGAVMALSMWLKFLTREALLMAQWLRSCPGQA